MGISCARATLLLTGLAAVLAVAVAAFARTRMLAASDRTLASAATVRGANDANQRFPVAIRQPDGPPRVQLGLTDEAGNNVTAACSTCHTRRAPDHQNRVASDLREFHRGLTLEHGRVTCLSCHNSNDYDSLALADGRQIAYSDVMELCAQCHGPQTRAYQHGAHGGMTGYWDLSRGPRERNNCVDCHDPHAPAFPKMSPTFKPRDRFLEDAEH